MAEHVLYTTEIRLPDFIVRDAANNLLLPIYRDGALVAPTAGTITVKDEQGTEIVSAAAVTIAGDIAQYSILAATLPVTLTLSERWTERWVLTMPDRAEPYIFVRDAHLVLRQLWPVIADIDLLGFHSELRQWMAEDQSSLQGYIDASWFIINSRLLENGLRPYLVLTPAALRTSHINLALAMAFRDYSSATTSAGKYKLLADHYQEEYEKSWSRLNFKYDYDEDEKIGSSNEIAGAQPVIMTTIPGSWWVGV